MSADRFVNVAEYASPHHSFSYNVLPVLEPLQQCTHLEEELRRLEAIWHDSWFGTPRTRGRRSSGSLSGYRSKEVGVAVVVDIGPPQPPFERISNQGPSASASCSTAINVGGRSPAFRGNCNQIAISPGGLPMPDTTAANAKPPLPPALPPSPEPPLKPGETVLGTWTERQYRLLSSDDEEVTGPGPGTRTNGRTIGGVLPTVRSRTTSTDGVQPAKSQTTSPKNASTTTPAASDAPQPSEPITSAAAAAAAAQSNGPIAAAGGISQPHVSDPATGSSDRAVATGGQGRPGDTDVDVPAGGPVTANGVVPHLNGKHLSRFAHPEAQILIDEAVPKQELGEDEAMQAAWRWRFTRRWQAEQTRGTDDARDDSHHGEDDVEEALQYLAACAAGGRGGWNICRDESLVAPGLLQNGSTEAVAMLGASPSLERVLNKSESMAGIEVTLGEDSPTRERRRAHDAEHVVPMPFAAEEVRSMRRAAHNVLRQQQLVEQLAEQRWKDCMGAGDEVQWVGAELQRVEVDKAGSFHVFVIRVKDHMGHQKIIVRGQNMCDQAAIVKKVLAQMTQAARKLRLPMGTMQVMGGGIMEWRRDHSSHVQIHSGFIFDSDGCNKVITRNDLLSLASVLIQHSLPPQYKVTVGV